MLPAVTVAAGAIGTAVLVRNARKPLKIIVVGEGLSGKTTLLDTWLNQWKEETLRTGPYPEVVGNIPVDTGKKVLFVKKRLIFKKVKDVSGADETMRNFREDVKAAKVILYLLKASHLEAEAHRSPRMAHGEGWVRIFDDATRLKWHSGIVKRLVFVVTYTDKDSRYSRMSPAEYHALIVAQLKDVIQETGMSEKAFVIAGSLLSEASAKVLAADIINVLL